MTTSEREAGRALVEWYRGARRSLPWRDRPDPYVVWVSEIMLQQTTVAAVAPRFDAFLAAFPDVAAIAEAPEEEVLAALQGLGYYRRFRAMKRAAEVMVREHGGALPDDREALSSLPGIGDYTAGAILSIAFGRPEAAVDGNVVRVLTRLFALPGTFDTPARRRNLGEIALEMMPEGAASAFNQALFDLGASICTPKSPRCEACPVRTHCVALRRAEIDRYPEVKAKRDPVDRHVAVALVRQDRKILIARRAANEARMPGFWQMPEVWLEPGEDHIAPLAETVRAATGMTIRVGSPLAAARHAITHHRLDCRLYDASAAGGVEASGREWAWWTPEQLIARRDPVSTVTAKLWRAYGRGRPAASRSRVTGS